MMSGAWRCALFASALALVFSAPASAHAVVKHSVPANGAVLTRAPAEVAITFNEQVEAMFSSASVRNAAGATVSKAKAAPDPANGAVLRLALPPLPAGSYMVKWNAVGSDGHRRNGEIRFSIK